MHAAHLELNLLVGWQLHNHAPCVPIRPGHLGGCVHVPVAEAGVAAHNLVELPIAQLHRSKLIMQPSPLPESAARACLSTTGPSLYNPLGPGRLPTTPVHGLSQFPQHWLPKHRSLACPFCKTPFCSLGMPLGNRAGQGTTMQGTTGLLWRVAWTFRGEVLETHPTLCGESDGPF